MATQTLDPKAVQAKLAEIRARNQGLPPTDSIPTSPTSTRTALDPATVRAKLEEIRAKQAAPQGASSVPLPKSKIPMAKPGAFSINNPEMGLNVAKQVVEYGKGAVKEGASMLLGVSKLGNQLLENTVGRAVDTVTGAPRREKTSETIGRALETDAFQATNSAQKAGALTAQIGSFFIPGGAVAKGAKAIEAASAAAKIPKFLKGAVNLAGRAGLEGLAGAGVTAAQGGDSKAIVENAALGAGGVVAGKLLGSAGKLMSKPLRESAEKSYAQALGATTKANKEIASKVVPELIDRKVVAFTRKGLLSKANRGLEAAGTRMDEVLETIPKDAPVNLSSVADDLENAKQAFMVQGAGGKMVVADPQAVQHIEGFQNVIKEIGSENAPYESVRKLRQIWDKSIAQSKGFYGKTVAEGSALDAKREAANAIRRELAKEFPDMAKVNAEYSFWSKTSDVLSATLERTQSQSKPLRETIKRGAGIVAGSSIGGPVGAIAGDFIMGGLSKLVDSTAWKTVSALQKSALSKALAHGDFERAATLVAKFLSARNVKSDK